LLVALPACGGNETTTASAASSGSGGAGGGTIMAPPWLEDARIFVDGFASDNSDCRTGICRHNENTDLVVWQNAIWLVHRTANSQVLGDNSSLHIYKSTDQGKTFGETKVIAAPTGRD